jgi:glycerol-1-phosphate dehydrogenase [NAD(P)+]
MKDWNILLSDIVAKRWKDPSTGKSAIVPFETIYLSENLDGQEADLVSPLKLGKRLAVVSDTNTIDAMGSRVARSLRSISTVDEIVLPAEDLSCDEITIENVRKLTRHDDGVVAVGSGVVSDLCKHATYLDGKPFVTFGTAASMNGYAASTASVTLKNGFKTSVTSHAPRGIFLDLTVSAAAPNYLSAAGLGDCLCRSTAQIDWWASHRLFDTFYSSTPYILQKDDENNMLDSAAGLASGEVNAVGNLHRVLTLCGLGVCFTGVSNHGSMGEHQVSHWIDMFAGKFHPGSLHGQQVGIASIIIARLQQKILAMETLPELKPTGIDESAILKRYGSEIGRFCITECQKKALDSDGIKNLNQKLHELWPALRCELNSFAIHPDKMTEVLAASGGPIDADGLGLDRKIFRNAVKYAREIRGRWSFLDLADDLMILDQFLEEEGL